MRISAAGVAVVIPVLDHFTVVIRTTLQMQWQLHSAIARTTCRKGVVGRTKNACFLGKTPLIVGYEKE